MHDVRLLPRSMMTRLPGPLSTERLASEISAVTRVIVILKQTGRAIAKEIDPASGLRIPAVHCQREDEMERERTGYRPLYAEAKKMKSLTLHTQKQMISPMNSPGDIPPRQVKCCEGLVRLVLGLV